MESMGLRLMGTITFGERFWSKVDRSAGPESCWLWKASIDRAGYGKFSYGHSRWVGAHRVAYELANGPAPGLHILHSCDNPPCVNPAHLRAGTNHENILDAVARRRINHAGEHNGNARLSAEQVREIREIDWSSGLTKISVARRYGVSYETIRQIRNGERWSCA